MTAIRIPNDLYEQFMVLGRAWGWSFSEMVRKALIADYKRGVVTTAHHEPTTREESEKHRIDFGTLSPPKTPQERDRFISVLRWYLTIERPIPPVVTTEPATPGQYTVGGGEAETMLALTQRLLKTCEDVAGEIESELSCNLIVSYETAAGWVDRLRNRQEATL
jgi:hypothetical protein